MIDDYFIDFYANTNLFFQLTDLCVYCETGHKLKSEIINFSKQTDLRDETFDFDLFKRYFESHNNEIDHRNIKTKLDHLGEINFHKQIANRQREVYNKYRSDPEFLGKDSILIDADWKEKIYYGKKSPRQVNAEWYKYGSCSLLGFGVYFVDETSVNGVIVRKVNCLNIDLLNENTSQCAFDFIKGLRFLRTLDSFKKIEKKNYIIFTDTAKSMRCSEICHCYLKELADENIRVSFNYFAEYHGKVN